MSLLHQDSPEEANAVARGEELTKGSSHVVLATVIAVVLVTIAIAAYVLVEEKPPAATGEVVQVWTHTIHTQTSGIDANGAPMAKEHFDQVLVITHVKLKNQSDKPLFLHEILTNAKPDDTIVSSYAAITADYERIFILHPELAALHSNAISPRATIAPGQTLDGNFISAFRLTKEQWDARKDWGADPSHGDPGSKFGLNYSFSIQYQHTLVIAPHTPVIEQ
jgi:hypothetical protein